MNVIDFLCQLAIILFSAKMLGILMRKLGLPQVLGFIIAGILTGPAVWGLLFDIKPDWIFPIQMNGNNNYLSAFAEIGVIFVMFTAGLETKLKDIRETGVISLFVAMCGVVVPLAGGFALGALFLPDQSVFTWLFVGVILTATSVGITVEVLRELNKLQTKAGTIILSAAIIDDVLGIIVLTIALSLSGGNSDSSPVLNFINPNGMAWLSILWIFVFFVFAIGAGFGLSKLFKFIEKRHPHTRRIPILSIVVCLMYAFIAEKVFGVAEITGAYIAGVVLSTNHASAEYTDRKVTISSYILFAPIFFAGIGLKISFASFTWDVVLFALCFVLMGISSKIIACGGAARLCKFNIKDSLRIGVGMIARGEVALIVMEKGIAGGLLDARYRAIVIMLVLTSSILAPILLKVLYKNEITPKLPSKQELEEGHFE